jgi:phosphoribosylglycinamide formyltransferase-1
VADQARLAVLISGRGSNLQAVHQACLAGRIDATVALVICNNPDAAGLAYCEQHAIPAKVVDHRKFADRESFDQKLADTLDAARPTLILLAGFMRLLSAGFTRRYESKLLNIHPSLLPRYKGLDTHQRVLDDGTQWHGCSVHFVTAELDGGPIVARSAIRVARGVSSDELAATLLEREHRLYPHVVGECINGKVQLREGKVMYKGEQLAFPLLV